MKSLLGLLVAITFLSTNSAMAHENYATLMKFINSQKRVFKFPHKHKHHNFPHHPAQIQVSKKGLKIPIMEAKEGDVLAFDGERWVPSDLSDMIGEGLAGPMGPQGLQGEQGIQGLTGNKGDQGIQGIPGVGIQGAQGVAGIKGDAGAVGPSGADGMAGAKGDKGDAGVTGAQGADGVAGVKGDKGDVGAMGPQGVVGIKGDAGTAGPSGADGMAGAKGDKGNAGVTGAQGADGVAGVKGDKGDAGAMGPQGLMGLMGLDGLPGAKGDKGDKGDAGAMGPQGLMGLMGLDGLPGAKGDKGDKGDAGELGPMGIQGLAGLAGERGEKGDKGDKGDAGRDANLFAGTNPGDMVQLDQEGRIPASVLPAVVASQNVSEVAYIRDQRATGVDGGSCYAGVWQKRTLNVHTGSNSFVTLANDQFTLQPGEYRIEGRAPAFQTSSHKAAIILVSTGQPIIVGSAARSHASSASLTDSFFNDTLIVNTTSTFEVHHICTKEFLEFGLGVSGRFAGVPEIYTQLKIEKVR